MGAIRSGLELLERSNRQLIDAVESLDENLLRAPTPCGDWNVSALLDHVTGGNRFTVNLLAGATADDALTSAIESFAGDHDPVAAVVESSALQLEAFARSGCLDNTYSHLHGQLTGEHVLRLRLHDVSVHIWDLLQAVQPGTPLDAAYVAWAVDELSRPDSLAKDHMASGLEMPSTAAEILVAFGRHLEPAEN